MNLQTAGFLFLAGVIGGALNAVAGGGSFVAFPALLFAGVPPIPANATNTLALWTGVVASGSAYRERLDTSGRVLFPLLGASLIGGLVGAFLLLKTPAHTFMRVLPWLMLGATLLFAFGRKVAGRSTMSVAGDASATALTGAAVFQLLAGIYGGYFGGGLGIVTLAMLAALGMTDIHAMNALKSVLGTTVNGVAVVAFIVAGAIAWPQAMVMIVGAMVGGYFGAHYAMRLPQVWLQRFVILVGTGMTIYFFVKAYGR